MGLEGHIVKQPIQKEKETPYIVIEIKNDDDKTIELPSFEKAQTKAFSLALENPKSTFYIMRGNSKVFTKHRDGKGIEKTTPNRGTNK